MPILSYWSDSVKNLIEPKGKHNKDSSNVFFEHVVFDLFSKNNKHSSDKIPNLNKQRLLRGDLHALLLPRF